MQIVHILKYVLPLFLLCSSKGISQEKTYASCLFAGELGNQMFEVANVLAYSRENQCEPIFYGLSKAPNGKLNLRHIFHRLDVLSTDPGIHFEDILESSGPDSYSIPYEKGKNVRFVGHFQSEKYFVRHSDYIKQVLAPSEETFQYIEKKYGRLETIFNTPVVGVHIRTFIPSARHPSRDGFGGATWEYFLDAINSFPEDYTFFIFSDDPDWVRQNFPPCNREMKFIKGNPHYIDLYLLSLCHHQVVSPESTFSWWAAWLNNNPNKVVIVPHFWQGCFRGFTSEHAFPDSWVRIHAENKFGY